MANDDGDQPLAREEKIQRQVGRTIANWTAVLLSLAVIFGWGFTGIYRLEPGEGAVILLIGKYNRTQINPGLHWHLPPPLESHEAVNLQEIRRQKFGLQSAAEDLPGADTATFETAIQTSDSNIVNLSYVVQYRVADAFPFLYGLADPVETLRDAAQSAVREVVGRKTIDEVLSSERGAIQSEARTILQGTLDSYFVATRFEGMSAFAIDRVVLQIVQPPSPVQEAFDDVLASQQDADRQVSVALGDAKEARERADAQSRELIESANAYKQARILEARGEAERFVALQAEYARAPEVTRRRLYLETMEQVLPSMQKMVVEPDAVSLMPFMPLGPGSVAAPPPAPGAEDTKRREEEP